MSELDLWRASGKEVSVAGLARSGTAAVRLLRREQLPVYASDAAGGDVVEAAAAALRIEHGEAVATDAGHHDLERVARSAALILSPGIPPHAAVVRVALDHGVPVLAEAQLGLSVMTDVPLIAVTGTNGKTTTTALIDHLLRSAGRRSVAAGNIGNPLSAVAVMRPLPEWLAVELSSFQLHDMPDLAPTVGVLTNLAPDHLDRYATLEEYYLDKAKLFANAGASSVWVSNLDDVDSRQMIVGVAGRHLQFSTAEGIRADGWYDRDRHQLILAGQALIDRDEVPLLGDHNVANVLAAALAVHVTGVDRSSIADALASFRPLRHRMEPVREVEGVLWINDSKATNVASARVAIQAMTRPFVLLLGGRHKGEGYAGLVGPLCQHGVAVVAYGEAGDLIEADLGPSIRVVRGTTFDDVIAKARVLAPANGAVLLSPACSSYDMFDNYEQRGATFRALVEENVTTVAVRHPGEFRWETRLMMLLTLILTVLGIATCYAAGTYLDKWYHEATQQLLAGAVGAFVFVGAASLDYRIWRKLAWPLAMGTLVGLVLIAMVVAVWHGRPAKGLLDHFFPVVNGAHRWIRVGVQVQPSEVARFTLTAWLAAFAADAGTRVRDVRRGFVPLIGAIGLVCVLVAIEPSVTMAITLGVVGAAVLLTAGARVSHLAAVAVVAILAVLAILKFDAVRAHRNQTFHTAALQCDIRDQSCQSLIGFGNGGVAGVGFGRGTQKFGHLADAYSDFLLSVFGEEWGFAGVCFLVACFAIFCWLGFRIAVTATDPFGTYLAAGLTTAVGFSALVHAAVVTRLMPTTGITLPFMSVGRVSLILNLFAAGVIVSIGRRRGRLPRRA